MVCNRCNKSFDSLDSRFLVAGPTMKNIYIICPVCKKEFLEILKNDLTSIIHNSMPLSETAKIFRERAKMYARSEVC